MDARVRLIKDRPDILDAVEIPKDDDSILDAMRRKSVLILQQQIRRSTRLGTRHKDRPGLADNDTSDGVAVTRHALEELHRGPSLAADLPEGDDAFE